LENVNNRVYKKIDLRMKHNKYITFIYYTHKMIIPIKCFTCGCVLANKYRYYKEEVRKKKLAKGMEDIEKVLYLTKEFNEKTPEGEVLDDLGLTKMCCRRHMLTHVDIE
jgi:DNA-directed RNA polymerase I, II, and III subunit RPABC5